MTVTADLITQILEAEVSELRAVNAEGGLEERVNGEVDTLHEMVKAYLKSKQAAAGFQCFLVTTATMPDLEMIYGSAVSGALVDGYKLGRAVAMEEMMAGLEKGEES